MTIAARRHRYELAKRVLDIVGGCVGLVLLSPVLVLVAGLVVLNLGRPILFVQDRPGRDRKIFRLYKFRTMRSINSEQGRITDDQRLTSFGRVLRSTSLDELPTLFNVVRGDMSMVGPRPLLVQYLDRYTAEQSRRHEVRPGITGLAQVSGRNSLDWNKKFALDIAYVENRSFAMDLRIMCATVLSVLKREGISAEGYATVSEFMGKRSDKAVDR
ncbi:sugar transferase [Parafrigoribacterium mesophilum]|uniref:sugar transferase n=1 Tax=Parafrigoribacterium mesophilum TaxID=433646 RepID=UPI0031FBD2CB